MIQTDVCMARETLKADAFLLQSKSIDEHPLSWLEFQEDCIMTACKEGEHNSVFRDVVVGRLAPLGAGFFHVMGIIRLYQALRAGCG